MIKKIIMSIYICIFTITPDVSISGQLNNVQLKNDQEKIKKLAKSVGSKICASNNLCFGDTLQNIAFIESNYGNKKISKRSKNISNYSLGTFQIKPSTAVEVIQKADLYQYKYLSKQQIIHKLKNDDNFSALIAGSYLRLNYEIGINRKIKNPYRFAISRYNGGNNNKKYIEKINKIYIDNKKDLYE